LLYKQETKMILTRTQFTETQSRNVIGIESFDELGLQINILVDKDSYSKVQSGNQYKFGVYSEGIYHWYFYGKCVANNREKMRVIFTAIMNSNENPSDVPFIYKVKRK
jgi:hypothetical protein